MELKKLLMASVTGILFGCTPQTQQVTLPSWNDTEVKQQLLNYLQTEVDKIPVEDRVAVFDMDGTIACEHPLWFEMCVAAQRMVEMAEANPSLKELTEFQYAQRLVDNPADTWVQEHWFDDGKDYIDSINYKAFEGWEHEDYVKYATEYLNKTMDKRFGMKYADMFYQPMLELMDELKQRHFQIYVVSGSMQGLVWSICPQVTGLDRNHLLGTRQELKVSFPKNGPVSYVLQKGVLHPHNNYYGKSVNIYNQIGKVPVVAIGNTEGDFGMFHMASCSTYPHLVLMLNHDDAEREYVYPPYYEGNPNWQDSLRLNGWIQADMSKEFKVVWKK